MKKIYILIMVLIISIFFFIGYALVGNNSGKSADNGNNSAGEDSAVSSGTSAGTDLSQTTVSADPIQETIKGMSLEQKIGQMFIVGIDGYESDENTRRMISIYHIGGFILYKNNISDPDQVLSLLNSLKDDNANDPAGGGMPLFLSVDEEGGRISRMPDGLMKIPSCGEIGKIDNAGFSYGIGSMIAEEIKAFGFNMDFAPVLDINSNPKNPVIGDRSFGTDSDIVSRLGIQTMKGMQSQGIIPVVKHFPGHGDTSVDSHVDLPIVHNDLERLRKFELVPFTDAVENGADAVMVAHILLPEIDRDSPASLSKVIITGILRNDLKFSGVIFTDDMTMGAIAKNYGIGDAAVKSVLAGSDVILVCRSFDKEILAIDAVINAVKQNVITEERINESVYRILKLKTKYSLTDSKTSSINIAGINDRISNILKTN